MTIDGTWVGRELSREIARLLVSTACTVAVPFPEMGKLVVGGQEAGRSQEFSFELGRLELGAERCGLLCPAASVQVWAWPWTSYPTS